MQASTSASCAGTKTPYQQIHRVRHLAAAVGRSARASSKRAASSTSLSSTASSEYEALRGLTVLEAATGQPVELLSLWQAQPGTRVVVPFLTHFADLSSWEFGQQLRAKLLPQLQAQGVQVITVGLGSAANARGFAAELDFPLDGLYADPTGSCYKALAFSPGFAADSDVNPYLKLLPMLMGIGSPGTVQEADSDVNPYLKLLPMLMGIGSPGTVQEVLRGYVGDRSSKPVYEGSTPFDILGTGYQRPFELATRRLFNMAGVLSKWGELSPPDTRLLTQQGGLLAFDGSKLLYRHDDTGILGYARDTDLLLAALASKAAA